MSKKIDYKKLDELCRQNIEDYDEKVSLAWGYMDRYRCPLEHAFPILYDEIERFLEDYFYGEDIEIEEIDIEQIISV